MASPAYLEAHGRPETPRDLLRHECLVHGEIDASVIWCFGRERGSEIPVPVSGRVAANSSEAVLVMARGGLGLALLAEWLVAEDLRKKRLVRPAVGRSVFVAPRALRPASPSPPPSPVSACVCGA